MVDMFSRNPQQVGIPDESKSTILARKNATISLTNGPKNSRKFVRLRQAQGNIFPNQCLHRLFTVNSLKIAKNAKRVKFGEKKLPNGYVHRSWPVQDTSLTF